MVENKLGIKVPTKYIERCESQNGGNINFDAFPCQPNSWAEDHVFIDFIYGISTDESKGILESEYLIKEWALPEDIVLISGDGHSWIALDYRDTKTQPSIIYIEKTPEDKNLIYKLTDNFEMFVQGLYIS